MSLPYSHNSLILNICEVHKIAKNISEVFAGDVHTPKADEVLDGLCWDQNDNICVIMDVKGEHLRSHENIPLLKMISEESAMKSECAYQIMLQTKILKKVWHQ